MYGATIKIGPFRLQKLQLNEHQKSIVFVYVTNLPFCGTVIRTVTEYNLY